MNKIYSLFIKGIDGNIEFTTSYERDTGMIIITSIPNSKELPIILHINDSQVNDLKSFLLGDDKEVK